MPANPFSPQGPNGASLTQEEWIALVLTPLQADSSVLSIPGVQTHHTAVPVHQPLMTESVLSDAVWAAPNDPVLEAEPNTAELVLMGRGVKALKVIVKISNETLRSSIDSLAGAQQTITNQLTKAVDKALINGSAAAGIGGLIPAVGSTTAHSWSFADGVENSTTTLTSATAAFSGADIGRGVSGDGIPAGTTIASVTNANTAVMSAAATKTQVGVAITVTSTTVLYDELVNALATSESAYGRPTSWLMNPKTIGTLRKMKTTQGLPLLEPDLSQAGGDLILGRDVISAPQAPVGTAVLIDPRTLHVALDLDGYARVLIETFAANDQTGLLCISRFDIGVSNPAGLVAVTGIV